ncbi:MAG: hypothetical protein WA997_10625 [Anaerolineales bacterium]|nr:hypothetical protein [Anaerolineales bacterium]
MPSVMLEGGGGLVGVDVGGVVLVGGSVGELSIGALGVGGSALGVVCTAQALQISVIIIGMKSLNFSMSIAPDAKKRSSQGGLIN